MANRHNQRSGTDTYSTDPEWADVIPIPQDEGGPNPLAAITYTDEYSEAMGYFRAIMSSNEFTERVLELTEHIITMNPAHYTIWCVSIWPYGPECRIDC